MKKRHIAAFVLAWIFLAAGLAGLLSLSLQGNTGVPETPGALLAVPILAAAEIVAMAAVAVCFAGTILLSAALRYAPSVPGGIKTLSLVAIVLASVSLAAEIGIVLLAVLPID
ncbi:MAG: hypothetical protein MJ088_00160 [Clostridia bacterium]|nr:hypothetical protein [Clostridia bacterium]